MDIKKEIAEAQRKAYEAEQLLSNPLFKELLDRLEAEYTDGWKNSAFDCADEREVAYFRLQALIQLKNDLNVIIHGGKIAEFNNRKKRL